VSVAKLKHERATDKSSVSTYVTVTGGPPGEESATTFVKRSPGNNVRKFAAAPRQRAPGPSALKFLLFLPELLRDAPNVLLRVFAEYGDVVCLGHRRFGSIFLL
jgi:hypothetical protein